MFLRLVLTAALLLATSTSSWSQRYPDNVIEFSPGRNAGFGSSYFPENVLGKPDGSDSPQDPNQNENHILTLGTGGHIILEFSQDYVIDGPGPDFTIFENPVQPYGFPERSFIETAIVSVSNDRINWIQFPCELKSTENTDLFEKNNYVGFAGIEPVLISPTNNINPFDPELSGGDKFDLAEIGVDKCRFIKIQDTGHSDFNPTYDKFGTINTDFGNLLDPPPNLSGGRTAGFDLDGIAAINTLPMNSLVKDWQIY